MKKQTSTVKGTFVAAHRDFVKDSYQYDIVPLDINASGGDGNFSSFEKKSSVPEDKEARTELDMSTEDIIDIGNLIDIKKNIQPSIIQGLLDDHDSQGHVEKDKKEVLTQSRHDHELYDQVPWKKCLYIKSPTLRLHQEIINFCSCLKPTIQEEKARNDALARIEDVVKALWPDSRLELFGSFATGLYLPTSDIDAVILDSNCVDVRQGLKVLGKALSQKGIATDIQTILKARVPIIKFEEKESGYQFDISFDAYNGPEAAQNVRALSDTVPAMSALTMVLKVFLQQRDLNEVYSGGIGSYALLVMVANFLQMHWSRFQGRKGDLNTNLGELLMDFFRLHGRALKHEVVGLSCSDGGSFFKKRSKSFHYAERPELPAVQDPNDDENDLGKNSYCAGKVRLAFDYAYTRLSAEAKPGQSMLKRVIRLDPIIFSRYKASQLDDHVHEGQEKPKVTSGSKRTKGQSKKQGQGRKKLKEGTISK